MPGGNQVNLYPGTAQVRNPCSRRVQAFEGSGKDSSELGNRQGKYIYLLCIVPENLLLAGYGRLLEICRGIPITSEQDRFKVEILKRLEVLNDNC